MAADPILVHTNPSVAVIVPTRGRSEFLLTTLGSILDQTYDGLIEVIVVYDQARIEPIPVAVSPNRRVRVTSNTRAAGLPGARNTGITMTQAEFVAFCDDDDEWLADKVTLQLERLRQSCAFAVGTGLYVWREGSPLLPRVPRLDNLTHADFLRHRNMEVHPSSLLFRREALLRSVGLVDEQIPGGYAEDYEFMLRLTDVAPLAVVREPLVKARWHAGSWFNDKWIDIAEALQYLLKKYPEFVGDRRGYTRIAGQIAFAYASQGRSSLAYRWALRAFRSNPFEARIYLALLVSLHALPSESVTKVVRYFGRGM